MGGRRTECQTCSGQRSSIEVCRARTLAAEQPRGEHAVRTFTDQELGNAAPFPLSFGAPVTAQFIIEGHAMRHSWHHLAAIRKALTQIAIEEQAVSKDRP